MKEVVFTNCFLIKTNREGSPTDICLAMKKRGHGEGLWNGSGGKPLDGETIKHAAKREIEEEFRVKVKKLDKRAEIEFVLLEDKKIIKMHAFIASKWEGIPIETEEMRPMWFKIREVPWKKMWDTDREWLSLVLAGKRIKAKYIYKKEGAKVKNKEIVEIN